MTSQQQRLEQQLADTERNLRLAGVKEETIKRFSELSAECYLLGTHALENGESPYFVSRAAELAAEMEATAQEIALQLAAVRKLN